MELRLSDIISVVVRVAEAELARVEREIKPIEVQKKCEVCGQWLEVGWFHMTCYEIDRTPLLAGPDDSVKFEEVK